MTLSQIREALALADEYDLIVPEDTHPSTLILDAIIAIDNRINPEVIN